MRAGGRGAHRAVKAKNRFQKPTAVTAIVGLCAGALLASSSMNASATQAPGDDVATWNTNSSWTYAQTFNYNDGNGTNVTINENVTYTNQGVTTFNGQSAYNVGLSGTITGGSGTANANGTNVSLSKFSGSVSGNEYIRRSDLALLQETQHQNLHATASVSFISTGVTASIDLTLTPDPGWRTLDFPLNNGDAWHENENVAYTGGFTYDAGSFGSGSSPFDGTFPFDASASVSKPTITVPIGTVATDLAAASNSDGSAVDNQWWSPTNSNLAQEHLRLPLNGATLTMDRYLSSASVVSSGVSLSETVTPSLSCAGGQITVSGRLSNGATGVPISVLLDESAASAGTGITATTTTTANGNYSVALSTPAASDGAGKNGSRANWGVVVDASSVPASAVATSVVTTVDCTTISNSGATSGPQNGTATVSATLTDLATPANAAGRQITFSLGGGGSVVATTNGSGVATATLPVNGPVRATTLTASFAGTSTVAAASVQTPFAVTVDPTSTSVVASPVSVTVGNPVVFHATVTPLIGANPTGTVQFTVDNSNFGAPVAVSNGAASSAALSTLPAGDHSVVAIYSGDANFGGSTSPTFTLRVRVPGVPTTTTLSVAPATSQYGDQVTFTATVAKNGASSADPSGDVTFTDGTTTIGTAALVAGAGGQTATLTTSALNVGTHNVVASYEGDDTFDPSASSPTAVTVTPADTVTAVDTSSASLVNGQAVTYTATVTRASAGAGTPTGTAQLFVDGIATGDTEPLTGGVAVFNPITSLTAGDHTIRVAYSGDGNFTSSAGTLGQHVDKAATAVALIASPSPSAQDQAVTLTATVAAVAPGSGDPSGTVTFLADGNTIGASSLTSTADGMQASVSVATLAPGGHTLQATYNGDADFSGSQSAQVDQTVISGAAQAATTTHISSSVNPSTYGQLITFTADVSAVDSSAGTPQGTVQFSLDGTNIGEPVSVENGVAVSPTIASPDPGDHLVIAAYLPGDGFAASGDTLTQTIADASVHVALSSSAASSAYGQSVTFHAAVSSQQVGTGVPTGLAQFYVDDQPLGTAVALSAAGTADSPAVATLKPGAHTVAVVYSGDVDFVGDSATTTQTVARIATTTTIASSKPAASYGDSITFTATVTPASPALGAAAGTVVFTDGTTSLGSSAVAPDGTATLTTSALAAGAHAITAAYTGSTTFAPSTSATLNQAVGRAATTMTADPAVVKANKLNLPLGQLKAHLSTAQGPLAGQTVVFTIGPSTACTVQTDATGTATCNAFAYIGTLLLKKGYTATYAGTANYQPSAASAGLLS